MANEHFFHKSNLIEILENCLNKTLGEVDVNNVFERTKTHPKITGIAGDVIEQSVLKYPADTRQEPDLNIDGVKTELKTTGIKYVKDGSKYEAKEPMSITAVSPDVIVDEDFEDSNFWHKLAHLLFVFYLYDSETTVQAAEYSRFPIKGYRFHEFNQSEKSILENDWIQVRDFLRNIQRDFEDYENQYPRLSSELRSVLLYIDTAPKWPNRPRFRLKRSVITAIVQEHFGESLEQLPATYLSYSDIDVKCHSLTEKFGKKSVGTLVKDLGIVDEKINKSVGEQIIVKMFDGKAKKMSKIELFSKIGLIGKTITITKQGTRTEDMKLFTIDFDEFYNDIPFEESSFYEYFSNNQILNIVFEEPSQDAPLNENVLIGFKRVFFDEEFIEKEVKPVWERIKDLILNNKLVDVVQTKKDGTPIINKTGVVSSAPNFPKASEGIIFVRGTSGDSTGKPLEINGIKMYKQQLWIKGKYMVEKLSKLNYL